VTVEARPTPPQAEAPSESVGVAVRPATAAYEKPAILWEQEFVALAQASEVTCDPPIDPRCF
jgi:hypothetical protein